MPADAEADEFGTAIAIHGSRIVVGASGTRAFGDFGPSVPGDAYVFERARNGRWKEVARLRPDGGELYDRFGDSVAIQGRRVAVGAPGDDGPGPRSGAVYVYRFDRRTDEWTLETRLTASDAADHVGQEGEAGHFFGKAVAFVRGGLAIGAPGDDIGRGAVYVFGRKGSDWVEEAKLSAKEGRQTDQLGWAVAAHGRTIVGGAFHVSEGGRRTGAVYVFEQDGGDWSRTARLTASDKAPLTEFGWSVAVRGGAIAVGAPGHGGEAGGLESGSAYVFRRRPAGWVEEIRLVHGDVTPQGDMGEAVAISGRRLIVGAQRDRSVAGVLGNAFAFSGPRWAEVTLLTPGELASDARFGAATAVRGRVAVVGAPGMNAAYVYE